MNDKISDSLLYWCCLISSLKISEQLSFLYTLVACTMLIRLAINMLVADALIFIHCLIKNHAAYSIQALLLMRTDFRTLRTWAFIIKFKFASKASTAFIIEIFKNTSP